MKVVKKMCFSESVFKFANNAKMVKRILLLVSLSDLFVNLLYVPYMLNGGGCNAWRIDSL